MRARRGEGGGAGPATHARPATALRLRRLLTAATVRSATVGVTQAVNLPA